MNKILTITGLILLTLFLLKTKQLYDERIKEAKTLGFTNGYNCATYRAFETEVDCMPVSWPQEMAVLWWQDSIAYRKFLDSTDAVR